MPVKLHYGPPGSYKTSGTIADDLPIAVEEGRVLITNVRGLNDADLVKEVFKKNKKKVNDDFEIIYLDTKREAERQKMRTFFHWAPQDSYLILDEINTIWPKDWRPAKLKEFDLHNGSDDDLKDLKNLLKDRHGNVCLDVKTNEPVPRAQNLTEALEMHRHFNYDFSATSPSYAKFNPVFHEVAEVAYGHMNRAIIGMKGSYWETMHTADNNGRSKSDRLSTDVKKIPKWVFKCYQSTATGDVRDTTAGSNIFLKPKIILPMVGAIALAFYALSELKRTGMFGENENVNNGITKISEDDIQHQPNKVIAQKQGNTNNNQAESLNYGSVNDSENASVIPSTGGNTNFLQNYKIYISGVLWDKKIFSIDFEHETSTLDMGAINELGYEITYINKCLAKFIHTDTKQTRLILCRPTSNRGSSGQRVNFNPAITNFRSE